MNLKTLILTNNDCYKAGKKITVKGIMVHSTGANNPYLRRYVGPDDGLLGHNPYGNHWNQPRPDGQQKCVHAFIGRLKDGSIATYQTLPWDHRGWHAGGKANDTHIGFEICEGDLKDPVYFNKVYQEAVELCAYLCKEYNIKPEKPWLICHSEGNKLGIASNHSDVMHWFPRHGKSMDDFRAEVKKALEKPEVFYYVQTGAYREKANADRQYHAVRAKGFDAIIKKSGDLYKVQVGAFANRGNAEAMAGKVKAAGFDVYITTEGGVPVPAGDVSRTAQRTQSKTIKVGSKVKVKPGAKTYDGKGLANFVYKEIYDVIQVDGDRVVIGKGKAVTAAVHKKDLILQSITPAKPTPKPVIKVGSKVKVKQGAKTYTGGNLASFVYNNVYEVIQINGDRVVIGKGKAVTAAVKKQDLILL